MGSLAWGARDGSATSSSRDAASRRKVPRISTVPAMPPTSELSCSCKWGHRKEVTPPSGGLGVPALASSSTQCLAGLRTHHQKPGEVDLGEEGALHGAELGARQGTEPSLQALGGGSVAPHQEAPQLRGVADHSLQRAAGAGQGELGGEGWSRHSPRYPGTGRGHRERAPCWDSQCGG